MTTCGTCHQPIHWVDCPTGGWWRHDQHPADDHDADQANTGSTKGHR